MEFFCLNDSFEIDVLVESCTGVQATAPTVSWYWRGEARTNYSLVVNTGSALVLGCLAKASSAFLATTVSPAFAITKGSAATIAVTAAGAAPFVFTPSGGTVIWDSVNGNSAGYDYVLVMVSIPPPPSYDAATAANLRPVSGYLQMYIPSLATSDAGLYYCTFYDGSSATVTDTFASSTFFSVTMTTKSGSGSSKGAQRNKALEYSIALLGASKMLF